MVARRVMLVGSRVLLRSANHYPTVSPCSTRYEIKTFPYQGESRLPDEFQGYRWGSGCYHEFEFKCHYMQKRKGLPSKDKLHLTLESLVDLVGDGAASSRFRIQTGP